MASSMTKKLTGPKLRKKLIRELDKLVGDLVKARHPYCVICHARGEQRSPVMQPGHLVSRRYYSVRWDLNNVFTQCQYHNSLHRFDTFPYDSWYIQEFGLGKWNALHEKKKELKQWKIWQLEELKAELTLML